MTWYGDSEDDVDDHQDPLEDREVGGIEEGGEECCQSHGQVVQRPEVLVLLEPEGVEVGDCCEESTGGTASQEQALLLMVEVQCLESFL